MELLYGTEEQNLKGLAQAKKVNADLKDLKRRWIGLASMKRLLDLCDEEVVSEHGGKWMKLMVQIIIQNKESDPVRQLAVANFTQLLRQSVQVSSASREISTNSVASMLTDLLQTSVQDVPTLSAIFSLTKNYPNPCGPSRSRLVKYLVPLMFQPLKQKRLKAVRCWSLVPFLGGGGPQRATHATQWESQMKQTVDALTYALSVFTNPEFQGLDPSLGSISLPLPHLPTSEPDVSYSLLQRICTLCQCVCSLLDVDFPYPLPVPVQDLVDVILQTLKIHPKMGHTTEMLLRASFLKKIHEDILSVFCKLTEICKRNLCRYSSAINGAFLAVLDVWKSKDVVAGKKKKYSDVRICVYDALLQWIQMCGATTRFLCGPSFINEGFLNHLMKDVTPVKDTMMLSGSGDPELSSRAKRRKIGKGSHLVTNGTSSDKIFDTKANSKLCEAALKVILSSIETMEHRLQPSIHKALQEKIIFLLMSYHQGRSDIHPYRRCDSSRFLLYHVLLALTLSPSPPLPPPVTLAKRIFDLALANETDLELRGFCLTAIAAIDSIVQPWRSAWHRCSVNIQESTQDIQVGAIIQPMNMQTPSATEENDEGPPTRLGQAMHTDSKQASETNGISTDSIFASVENATNGGAPDSQANSQLRKMAETEVSSSAVLNDSDSHSLQDKNAASKDFLQSQTNSPLPNTEFQDTSPPSDTQMDAHISPGDDIEETSPKVVDQAGASSKCDDTMMSSDDIATTNEGSMDCTTTEATLGVSAEEMQPQESGATIDRSKGEKEEVSEDVQQMLLDFVDASPDADDDLNVGA